MAKKTKGILNVWYNKAFAIICAAALATFMTRFGFVVPDASIFTQILFSSLGSIGVLSVGFITATFLEIGYRRDDEYWDDDGEGK